MVAYNVSGEYSMVKAAAQQEWLEERTIALENLTAINAPAPISSSPTTQKTPRGG